MMVTRDKRVNKGNVERSYGGKHRKVGINPIFMHHFGTPVGKGGKGRIGILSERDVNPSVA